MNTTHILKLTVIFFLAFSCQNDAELRNDLATAPDEAVVEKTIENGRFVFSSKASLEKTMKDLENNSIENVEKEFESYYASGFRSHTPLVGEHNEALQEQLSREIAKRYSDRPKATTYGMNTTIAENYEEKIADNYEKNQFIADPFFAAVVNQDHEIIVGDSIYKYTKDQGLFFAHRDDMDALISYVDNITAPEETTFFRREDPCFLRQQYGGVTQVNDKISRYVRRLEPEEDCFGGGGGGGGSPLPVPSVPEDVKINRIINSLPICNGKSSSNWFQRLFGKNYVCRSYFDSKHRIKTEFWDQKWLIYTSVGIQVRTQRKRFWIWWASKSDEIHLGINRILLKYDFPQPEINSYSHPELFPKKSNKNPIYLWDGKFIVNYSNNSLNFVETQIDLPNGHLPFFDFKKKNILNIYIPKLYKKGKYNLNLTTDDILSQSNIKALYQMGIDFLKSSPISNSGALNTPFVVTYQRDYNNIEVLYFGERYKKNNDNYIKRKFYSNVSFLMGAVWNDSGGWSFNVKAPKSYFRKYKHYDLDFYGMARRGGTWRGNRIIRK